MGEIALLASAGLWTLTSVFMRFGGARMDLLWLNALRTLIGLLVLVGVVLLLPGGLAGVLALPRGAVFWLVVSVVIGFGLGDTLFFRSSQLIGVSRSMPLSSWHPLVAVIIAVGFLGETANWRFGLGSVFILGGIYLIAMPRGRALPSNPGLSRETSRQGTILAVLAALCWGFSVIATRMSLEDPAVDFMGLNAARLLLATLFLLAIAWVRGGSVHWRKLTPGFLGLLAIMGAVNGTLGTILWLYGVQQAGAARAAILGSTSPLFGLPLSVLLLGEKLTWRTVGGTVLTTFGVWLIL